MASRRRGWDELSASYRSRLSGAGVTRSQYEAGADLRKARGHGFRGPRTQAPEEATERIAAGLSTPQDRQAIERWRRSRSYPSWLPKDRADLDDATAAILSTISPRPDARDRAGRRAGWRDVEFIYQADGTVRMVVTPVRGYPFEVELPDRDSASQVQAIVSNLNTPGIEVDVAGEGYPRARKKARPKKRARKARKATKKTTKKATKRKRSR